MSTQQLKQRGFTIIEVVLVLAIAALIFLMVFIALPALQRSQRDTARKSDVSVVTAAVTSYQSNNRGVFPNTTQLVSYVTNVSGNTTSETVGATITAANTSVTAVDGIITVYPQGVCNASGAGQTYTLDKGTAKQYATVTLIESGGTGGSAFCLQS